MAEHIQGRHEGGNDLTAQEFANCVVREYIKQAKDGRQMTSYLVTPEERRDYMTKCKLMPMDWIMQWSDFIGWPERFEIRGIEITTEERRNDQTIPGPLTRFQRE